MVATKRTLYVVVFTLFTLSQLVEGVSKKNVKMEVYYGSLCPDSSTFISEQLYPLLISFGGVQNDFLLVEYIPFGKGTVKKDHGKIVLESQHGSEECYGNKVHGCALKTLAPKDAVAFIDCSLKSITHDGHKFHSDDASCFKKLGIDGNNIEKCAKSEEASEMISSFGNKTNSLRPKLYYIPWIVIDGKWTRKQLEDATDNLEKLICLKLKKKDIAVAACKDYY